MDCLQELRRWRRRGQQNPSSTDSRREKAERQVGLAEALGTRFHISFNMYLGLIHVRLQIHAYPVTSISLSPSVAEGIVPW